MGCHAFLHKGGFWNIILELSFLMIDLPLRFEFHTEMCKALNEKKNPCLHTFIPLQMVEKEVIDLLSMWVCCLCPSQSHSRYAECSFYLCILSAVIPVYVFSGFTCALQKEILYQGKLFVSENWICFHSKVFGKDTKVCIICLQRKLGLYFTIFAILF